MLEAADLPLELYCCAELLRLLKLLLPPELASVPRARTATKSLGCQEVTPQTCLRLLTASTVPLLAQHKLLSASECTGTQQLLPPLPLPLPQL